MKGLLIRRYTEATLALGYDPSSAYNYDIALPTEREWQPDWVNPDTGDVQGRYYDRVLAGKTKFKDVLRIAQRYPLPESTVAAHAQVAAPLPYQPAPIEAPSAVNLDSPTPAPVGREIPVQLPIPEIEYEDTPAAPVAMDANGTAPETQPSLAPARVPQPDPNTGSSKPASPAPAPTAPQSPPGPVSSLPPPKPPVVIAPKSIDIRSIPYGEIDAANGAKNMTDSQRGIGLAIVAIGSVVQILAGREIVSSTVGAVFFDMSRDPAVVAIIAGGVVMFVGWLTRKRGQKVMTDGMRNATQVLK